MTLGRVVVDFLDAKFCLLAALTLEFGEAAKGQAGRARAKLQDPSQLYLVISPHNLPEAIEGQRFNDIAKPSRFRIGLPISQVNRRQATHKRFKFVDGEEFDPGERDDLVETLADLLKLAFDGDVCVIVAL